MSKYLSVFIISFLFCINFIQAGEVSLDIKVLKIDSKTLQKGYTIDGFNGEFKVGIFPEVLSEETNVAIKDFYAPEKILPMPTGKKIISHIYEFDISNKEAFKNKEPLIIEIKYDDDYIGFKTVYYWDGGKKVWVKIPSNDITGKKKVRANLHLPYARLAVFEDKNAMEFGVASYYRWKDCDCAASPDYPKGTRLKVTNIDNKKSVIVTVNDYGPVRAIFPERAIDLDKTAFAKIASLSAGLCNVRVELAEKKETAVNLTTDVSADDNGTLVKKTEPNFRVNAKSAIIVNSKNGKIIWAKNSGHQMPIASITKLMAAKVVLDLDTNWEKVITYSASDDDVTDYAEKWEMAYLNVKIGEQLTVKDLFFSSLVGSANNAVYALARSTGLLRNGFTETMNRKAKELGMENTHFTEPSGLDPANISTAQDLAKLGRKVFNSMDILRATTNKAYSFQTLNTEDPHTIKNRNRLLATDMYILGTKTGYLDEAGRCLIVKAKNENQNEIIVVTLGNFSKDSGNYFKETEELTKWGLEQCQPLKMRKPNI
ncbi:MAG: RlpA-like double-psi beta-barrel domain-containing protein [Patescibacteria group bacterium]|nr:RlpA-like double-psi beta-barrel domain-containing protein [Patescibacteria group bacterium]